MTWQSLFDNPFLKRFLSSYKEHWRLFRRGNGTDLSVKPMKTSHFHLQVLDRYQIGPYIGPILNRVDDLPLKNQLNTLEANLEIADLTCKKIYFWVCKKGLLGRHKVYDRREFTVCTLQCSALSCFMWQQFDSLGRRELRLRECWNESGHILRGALRAIRTTPIMGLLFYIERLHLTVIADATAYHLKCENKSRCCTLDCRKRSYRGGGGGVLVLFHGTRQNINQM